MERRPSRFQLLTRDDFCRMDFAAMDSIQLSGSAGFTSPDLFLRRYTSSGMRLLLARTGFIEHLDMKGYGDPLFIVSADTSGISTLRVYNRSVSPENLLVDLRVSEQRFNPAALNNGSRSIVYDMIFIEWLLLRDPGSSFRNRKQRLPAQDHPGLGALSSFFKLMVLVAEDIRRDAFMAVPDHLHAAIMYCGTFSFFDPVMEGTIRALKRDLSDYHLWDIAWAHATGAIRDALTGKSFVYIPSVQVYPVSERMKKYFRSRHYLSAMRDAGGSRNFILDERLLDKKRKAAMDEDMTIL